MDKRKEANQRVKGAITDALFSLMQEQPLDRITITDVIRRAGVARISFYRNYTSKEDVLVTLVRDVLDEYRTEADYDLADYTSRANVVHAFRCFQQYKSYALNLYHSGFCAMLLEELNRFHVEIAGNMPARSPKRYQLYAFIGALLNTAIVWLEEEAPAPVETVAEVLLSDWRDSGPQA